VEKVTLDCDIALAGGGLSAGLIAYALSQRHPELDLRIVDQSEKLGGNHVWSFFDSDIAPENRWIVEPLICHRWEGYDVHFPAHSRTLNTVYNSIESDRLDEVLRAALPPGHILTGTVTDLGPSHISLADGRTISARLVVDARGPGDLSVLQSGWQKFVGQALTIKGGHGLIRPIVMDATVPQLDGYRFVYCLPFDAQTVFVEDTYYSDTPDLDVPAIRARIVKYADAKGWSVAQTGREETGVLPVIIGGNFRNYWKSSNQNIEKAGLRAGLCQPVTGYSLPDAVRLAARFAADPHPKPGMTFEHAEQIWRARGFYRMLDAMLFRAAEPQERYRILQRFYGLSERLITRFYAGHSTWADKLRVLAGKPPVPVGRAIRAILEKRQ
jgi:lycopene beta-cyclase